MFIRFLGEGLWRNAYFWQMSLVGNLKQEKILEYHKVDSPKNMYNMNGFRTETMYDYYIAMKSIFLIVKLSSHPSIGYASLPFFYCELHTNNTKTKSLSKSKLQFSQTLYSYYNFVQMKVFLQVTNTSLYTNQKETNQETS